MNKVSILEVGPRDGLQSEPAIIPTEIKKEFIVRTVDAGIKKIEVTSFVHPKKVPQMADAEKLVESLPDYDD
ncbi:MAG TPA: hydroxymethylglutaryl-CoA lyase, partial [Gammaproteobacteria bacterium]|nr:hydroxymethylglutaryl-CoA lyase [Gammaproteobacteria bacterium]